MIKTVKEIFFMFTGCDITFDKNIREKIEKNLP